MESCFNIKSDEIRARKEEFELDTEAVDWMMAKGVEFSVAICVVNHAKELNMSIPAAFIDLVLENQDEASDETHKKMVNETYTILQGINDK